MDIKTFEKIIVLLQEQQRRTDLASRINVDVIEFMDPLYQTIDLLIKEIYGEEGYDWFTWFCYDSDYGKRDWSRIPCFTKDKNGNLVPANKRSEDKFGAFDSDGSPICFSVKSTWEFLEENYSKTGNSKKKKKPGDMKNALRFINGKDEI